MLLVAGGVYGVLVAGSLPGGGIPFVALGAVLVGFGLAAGGRRTRRTRYRPEPWGLPEWLVTAAGAGVVGCMVAAGVLGVAGLEFSVYPLTMPGLPLLAVGGILLGLLPAWVAPVERRGPGSSGSRPRRPGGTRPTRRAAVPGDAATTAEGMPAPVAPVPSSARSDRSVSAPTDVPTTVGHRGDRVA